MASEGHKGTAVYAGAGAEAAGNTSPMARSVCMQLVSRMHLCVDVANFLC